MTGTVLVIGGTGALGARWPASCAATDTVSGCWRERCRQLPTATPIWIMSRATWTTPTRSPGPGWLCRAAPDAEAPLLRAKFHAEQAITAGAVPFTIFRPTCFMESLPRLVRSSRAVVLGRQPRRFHMLAAADFGRMVSRALATPESAGKRLDVHGPDAVTIADALGIYCARHP